MDSEEVSLPLIHRHPMMPMNDMRKGGCCGRFEATTDGYFCEECNFFCHKKCCDESSESIQHPSHPHQTLRLVSKSDYNCNLCGRMRIKDLFYNCEICNFDIDLYCAKYPPPEVIDISKAHNHKLTLLKVRIEFECEAKCGKDGYGFPYKCHECDLAFHVDCVWHPLELKHHPLEVNHSYHSLHPLKLHTKGQLPNYSDGKCSLCLGKIDDRLFYHCSLCKFTLDMRCVLHPPLKSLLHLKAHDHQLTFLPRLDSFICNACGLRGDRSRYVCFQCGFTIHQDCLSLPRVININRHDHRVYRTSVLGVENSTCGVCRKKVDWSYGGFSCQKCPSYVVHSKCATRKDVWNGEELEGIPEETEDIQPYLIIDENTIQHFSHKEHYLRLHVNDVLCDDNKRCRACTHPICLQSFYSCMECDFILHQNCVGYLRKKRHFLHNDRLTLVTNKRTDRFWCDACRRWCNGFSYEDGGMTLDVRCASISEPFFHPSHSDHPLYYTSEDESKLCDGCNLESVGAVLRCIEFNCEFVLCMKCATIPFVVKHRVDDHPLSLCYGEKSSGKYWCDICEKEIDPEEWYYTCKDQRASLHTRCVLGDFSHLMPGSLVYDSENEVVLNNSVSRPICNVCKLHCIYPIILKNLVKDVYYCSPYCLYSWLDWCIEDDGAVLRCIEDDCKFFLCFGCATIPFVVKHRVHDHPLSLCYGEKSSGKYWCDICEKEIDPGEWFYTCKDQRASLHTRCVLGDFSHLLP